jgi:hypothetical protein
MISKGMLIYTYEIARWTLDPILRQSLRSKKGVAA